MSRVEATFEVAVDIGGTFTDGILIKSDTNEILLAKSLTTPGDPGNAVITVVEDLLSQAATCYGMKPHPLTRRIIHGTTLVTNTLLERRGARVALIVTRGTRDSLNIRRELRYDIYDLELEFPDPLVSRDDRFEVNERLGPTGEVWLDFDRESLADVVKHIASSGYQAIAVCLLHSYANGEHERIVAEELRKALPSVPLSLSSEIAPEIGEYERMSTVAANAYVQPLVSHYLAFLIERLRSLKLDSTLDIMVSNGTFTKSTLASRAPIRLLESGPAGGVLSAINCAEAENIKSVLAFDMGGTTAKACVSVNGVPSVTHVFEFGRVQRFKRGSGLPAVAPSIDLIEIGAGGGSLARVNALGLLQVGPHSAGSEPGPACYDRGGKEATVTDADLALGYLDPKKFLGGRMNLNVQRATDALQALGTKLNLSATQIAVGIHDLVNEKMAAAARTHIAEKGLDPRRFCMVATGGAGPVHAVDVARRLRIREVICPIASGVGSCLGFLAAPARADHSWSKVERLHALDLDDVKSRIAKAREAIISELDVCGVPKDEIVWSISADLRYVGQGDTVEVRLGGESTAIAPTLISSKFEAEYARLFGRTMPGGMPEVVTWRISGESKKSVRTYRFPAGAQSTADLSPPSSRPIYLPLSRSFEEVPVYSRYSLALDAVLKGPLILTEAESAIVVAYPAQVKILKSGSVHILLDAT